MKKRGRAVRYLYSANYPKVTLKMVAGKEFFFEHRQEFANFVGVNIY